MSELVLAARFALEMPISIRNLNGWPSAGTVAAVLSVAKAEPTSIVGETATILVVVGLGTRVEGDGVEVAGLTVEFVADGDDVVALGLDELADGVEHCVLQPDIAPEESYADKSTSARPTPELDVYPVAT